MPLYEARFIDFRGEVFSSQPFSADHDEGAKGYAQKILKTRFGKGHEVWDGQRLVHKETY